MLTIYKKTTMETTWEAIAEAVKAGTLRELMGVGDEIPLELKTGEKITVQLADIRDRAFFVLKDCMKELKPMNERMTNKGGWAKCRMREWLNGTVLSMLPDDLQGVIQARTIRQGGEETEDKLWLPSFGEMFGENEDWTPVCGDEQFELYKSERSRVKEAGDNGTWWYWLRSPYSSASAYFCCVNSDGLAYASYASSSSGVAFGFCI